MTRAHRRSTLGQAALAAFVVCCGGFAAGSPVIAGAEGQAQPSSEAVVAALQRLTAPDGALDDRFGDGVAIDGDTAAIGAPNDDVGGLQNRGSVYIFTRIGSTWTFQTKIAPADPKANERFGQSVALQGITLVVGTAESTGSVEGHGSAYVFVGSGPAWAQQQKLTSTGLTAFGQFGDSVAIDGSTIVVGAPGESGRTNGAQGAAHVFVRNGATWTLQQRLFADDGLDRDGFGNAVAIRGDRAVVGARFSTVGGAAFRGSVYIFQRSTLNFTWSQEQKVVANDGAADDSFGFAVSMDATRILVGAPGATLNGSIRGAAYVLSRSGLPASPGGSFRWIVDQKLVSADPTVSGAFGSTVNIRGTVAIIGAPTRQTGFAFIFMNDGRGWSQDQTLTAANTSRFGASVAFDGVETFLVGAREDEDPLKSNGSAHIFGTPATPPPPPPPTGLLPPVQQPPVVTGSTVRVSWGAVTGATRYQLRAGTAAGASNAFDGDVGNTTSLTATSVPNGSYFIRVHAVGAGGESAPSNEVRADVGLPAPCVTPAPPTNLTATVAGAIVTLRWNASVGAAGYSIEAGSASGLANLAIINVGSAATTLMAAAPPGRYFVRLRASAACGASAPSNEIIVLVN